MEWKALETLVFSWEWASDIYAISYLLLPWLAGGVVYRQRCFLLEGITSFQQLKELRR